MQPPDLSEVRQARVVGDTDRASRVSTTDPDAKLYRKGPGMEARPAFLGRAPTENRSGLLIDACLNKVSGHAKRFAALAMIKSIDRPAPLDYGRRRPGLQVLNLLKREVSVASAHSRRRWNSCRSPLRRPVSTADSSTTIRNHSVEVNFL
jgi:hypothetical protein